MFDMDIYALILFWKIFFFFFFFFFFFWKMYCNKPKPIEMREGFVETVFGV